MCICLVQLLAVWMIVRVFLPDIVVGSSVRTVPPTGHPAGMPLPSCLSHTPLVLWIVMKLLQDIFAFSKARGARLNPTDAARIVTDLRRS